MLVVLLRYPLMSEIMHDWVPEVRSSSTSECWNVVIWPKQCWWDLKTQPKKKYSKWSTKYTCNSWISIFNHKINILFIIIYYFVIFSFLRSYVKPAEDMPGPSETMKTDTTSTSATFGQDQCLRQNTDRVSESESVYVSSLYSFFNSVIRLKILLSCYTDIKKYLLVFIAVKFC